MILKGRNRRLAELIDKAVSYARAGQQELAAESTKELQDYWEEYYVTVSYLVQTSKLEDISYSVAKLDPLLETGSEEFYSECRLIKYGTELIYKNEFPDLHSVL